MEFKDRMVETLRALPIAHRIGMGAALGVLALASVWFMQWVSAPTYTVLSSGLDSANMAEVINALETQGVPYEIGAGGTTIMVPRNQLYTTRASLAQSGVTPGSSPEGYAILDGQPLTVSDAKQQIDIKRALEGEIARTLTAMEGISGATVLLVLPEDRLFTTDREPATASVLLDTTRTLGAAEVEGVVFLVSSSVEGLEAGGISVVESSGVVLHSPGDGAVPGAVASRQLRETREFEGSLEADIIGLLQRATGSPASVVVRADLNFDQVTSETEDWNEDSQIATKEQTLSESFVGEGAGPNGVVGVDGGPLAGANGDGASEYQRDEVLTEYGVDRIVTVTNQAQGKVERLSVAIVMDDGTLTGAAVPSAQEVTTLVSAAVGLDVARGDVVEVSAVPFSDEESGEVGAAAVSEIMSQIPQFIALLVLVVVAIGLFLMTRRRGDAEAAPVLPAIEPGMPVIHLTEGTPAEVVAAVEPPKPRPRPIPPDDQLKREVTEMVERQPEEIATLLRGWLADQRSHA